MVHNPFGPTGSSLRVPPVDRHPLLPVAPAEQHLHVIEALREEEEEPRVQRSGGRGAGAPRSLSNGEERRPLATPAERLKRDERITGSQMEAN